MSAKPPKGHVASTDDHGAELVVIHAAGQGSLPQRRGGQATDRVMQLTQLLASLVGTDGAIDRELCRCSRRKRTRTDQTACGCGTSQQRPAGSGSDATFHVDAHILRSVRQEQRKAKLLAGQISSVRTSELLRQLIRFGIAGGISSLIYAGVYLPLVMYVFPRDHAVYAVPFAFAIAVTAGYFLHSRWSFKGHRSGAGGRGKQVGFVLVQASGMTLNAVITWVGTALLGYPAWVPLLPAVGLATILTFILNRWLIFR